MDPLLRCDPYRSSPAERIGGTAAATRGRGRRHGSSIGTRR